MGTWQFKSESYTLGASNDLNSNPVGGYRHSNGDLYYVTGSMTGGGGNVWLWKTTPDGVTTKITGTQNYGAVVGNGNVNSFIAVPYFNSSSGKQEVHFILGLDLSGTRVLNSDGFKLIFNPDGTVTTSMFTPAGTCRADTLVVYSGTWPAKNCLLFPFFMDDVLYYWLFTGGTNFTIQKYSPTLGWQDVLVNASFPSTMRVDGYNHWTIFSVGSYIYVLNKNWQAGQFYNHLFYKLNPSNGTFIALTGNSLARYQATPLVIGEEVYFLGGLVAGYLVDVTLAPTVVKWNYVTDTWTDTGVVNAVNIATPANAVNVGGEILFFGGYFGGNTTVISKFTYVLEDVVGFSANYQPETNTIGLLWTDSSSGEETFYQLEQKTNSGSWVILGQVGANETYYPVSGCDIQNNVYSFRIKKGKLVVT